jgi:hypothetical protein
MEPPRALIQEIEREYLADLSLEGTPHDFVSRLDERLNQVYEEAVERYYKAPPWDLPGVLLAICCYFAWGEVRSVETFSRQAVDLGFGMPRLRLLLSKQIYEEMVHYQMFREAAIAIGGVDPIKVRQSPTLMSMFNAYDEACGSEDILEKIYYSQFCSERAVLPSYKRFKESMKGSRRGLHPLLERAFDRVLRDEPGHVAVGRLAAWELAERGAVQRKRMIEMAGHIIAITINVWKTETKSLTSLLQLAASLAKAKIKDTWKRGSLDNCDTADLATELKHS